jgi:TP901 family phage tail tape measure protein
MANRTVAVNFTANTAAYVAGVGKAAAATGGLQAAAAAVVKGLIGPGALIFALTQAVKWANATEEAQRSFATELLKLQTQIGLTTDEMHEMGRAALFLSGETTKGPQELAEAMFFIASAGLRGAAAMDVLRSSAQLSAIGLGETTVIADLLTSAVNAYGEEALSASGASDALVSAVRLGKLEADQLAGAMGRVLPIASAMGVTFDEVSGLMAAMSKTGTDAASASTQIRAIMVSLLKPTQQANDVMTELGFTQQGIRDTIMEDGLFAALLRLNDAVDGNTARFAELFPNVRALAGVMDLLGPQLQGNIDLLDQHAQSAGLASEAFSIFSQSQQADVDRIAAARERLAILQGEYQVGIRANLRADRLSRIEARADRIMFEQDHRAMRNMLLNEAVPAVEAFRRANFESTEEMRRARAESQSVQAGFDTLARSLQRMGWAEVSDQIDNFTFVAVTSGKATLEQYNAVARLIEGMDGLRNAIPVPSQLSAWERGLLNGASAADKAADAEEGLADALGFTNAELLDQIKGLREKLDGHLALIDPVYAAIKAEQDYAKATDEVNTLIKEGKQDTEEYINALFEQEFAFLRMQGALNESGVVMERFIEHLNVMIAEGRLTEEQVQRIIDRLGEQGHAMDLIDGRVVSTRHVHTVETITVGSFQGQTTVPIAGQAEFRARGGPISAGRPYIVGEEGPELIIPSGAGRVMSAPQTQGMMGGSSYNVTVNMPPGADGDQVVSALRRWERSNGPIPVGVR